MKCEYCQSPLPAEAKHCPGCGAAVPPQQAQPVPQAQPQPQPQPQAPVQQKSAGLAQILSCLIPGLGQIYNGQVAKGIVLIIANITISSATFGITALIFLIIAIVDAGKIANKINAGQQVGDWEFF